MRWDSRELSVGRDGYTHTDMNRVLAVLGIGMGLLAAGGCRKDALPAPAGTTAAPAARKGGRVDKIVKTDAEWKKILTPEQYRVLRQKDT